MPGYLLALRLIPLVFLTAALVCMVLAFLWNRRRQRADWSERALALKAPISTERKRVILYLRHGAAAPDPELAHLTVRVAEDLRRRLENPWQHTGLALFVFGSALNLIIGSLLRGGPVGLAWFGFAAIAVVVWGVFHRQVVLDRADRALAANRELAEQYVVPEEGPVPPPRER
ncbi:hypothetical protein NE857_31815 [Nocardiopsis exhalans]|uniref:Uncharacterized protein n=1 Tax=Nocardiopsis exhalans TaxID=163604 RepID=A0ABY5D8W1_9ACTN|nr:hypothetical protein [Nocardiopsis exhalans]USY19764.1 hypothetical protein NE857_31815 [Nocardiopsis exhalans]